MSAAQTIAVIDRVVAKHNKLGDNYPAYTLLVFSILAHHAPEVLEFILDRADERVQFE